MNWMTCKLEAELFPKCLALGLLSQLEDGSWSRDCWALSHRASYPPCRQRTPLSGMPSDLSDLCVHLSKLLGPGHYSSLTLFCILVTAEPEGQPERERQRQRQPHLLKKMETFGLLRYLLFLTISLNRLNRECLLKDQSFWMLKVENEKKNF